MYKTILLVIETFCNVKDVVIKQLNKDIKRLKNIKNDT